MLSVASLGNAIRQQQSDAENKRLLVEKLMRSAEEHAERGDEVRAKLDGDSAQRYLRDLEYIEKTISEYETEIAQREQKANEIDKQIDELNLRFARELEELEKAKLSVTSAFVVGSDIEVVRRELKNRGIDSKEEELHKRFKHDLDKLEREKDSILG